MDAVKQYMPGLLSAITIWMTLLAGNKHPKACAEAARAPSIRHSADSLRPYPL